MKYLYNNNSNHFFIKKKLKASIYTSKWTKEDDMMIHQIMWGSRLCKKESLKLSFQFPLSNAHMANYLAHIHKPKKALETKVNEIKGRDKKVIHTRADETKEREKKKSETVRSFSGRTV